MTSPWYVRYFGPDYWAVARYEYTPERTAGEVRYLTDVLAAHAPGGRVADLGCGTGRHAVALARAGFAVTGVDVSSWAIERAQETAREAGLELEVRRADLLVDETWADAPFDAAISIQAFGWGTDAEQLRMLRRIRDRLRPGGLLILDHSNVSAILKRYVPEATFTAPDVTARFHREYHPLSGRSRGWVDICHAHGRSVRIHDDVRLYQPPEIDRFLRTAGFAVERIDGEFTLGGEVTSDTRYVQFVAQKPESVLGGPALDAYQRAWDTMAPVRQRQEPNGEPEFLDLRWSPDEAQFVDLAVDYDLQRARHLAIEDPYAAMRAAPVLARHFDVSLTPAMVTAGTGVTGLLHTLAAVTVPGPLFHAVQCHPELPRLAYALGVDLITTEVVPDSEPAWTALGTQLDEHRPAVVLVDRPTVLAEMSSAAAIGRLASLAAQVGTLVIVDEAYANYADAAHSVVGLVTQHPNLVVLRGVSKGYCCGGLRVAFALAGEGLTERIRQVAPPLAAPALSLDIALHLLETPDALACLRRRIGAVKPGFLATLHRHGLRVAPGHSCLPWVAVVDNPHTRDLLRQRRVLGKPLPTVPASVDWTKLSVPLSDERLAEFRSAFKGSQSRAL